MTSTMDETKQARALPREVRNPCLHHVGIKTRNMDEFLGWYRIVVGMEVVRTFPSAVFASNDASNHRLSIFTGAEADSERGGHAGLHHLAFEFGSLEELLGNYVRLKEHGIMPYMTVNHGPTTSFYYVDPDGNDVELQVDNFHDWEKSKHFMCTSDEFGGNPVGSWVDPERLVAAWEAGASADEIHQRGYFTGEFAPTEPPRLRPVPGVDIDQVLRLGYVDGKLPGERHPLGQ